MVRIPETHGEILAAAARRFAVTGYKATSLQDIAREVGCSKAAVLYHFANKEAILVELMAPAITALREFDDRLAGLDGAAAREAAAEGFVDLAVRFRNEIALLHGDLPELLEHPAFAHVQRSVEQLLDALAGRSDRVVDRIAALVVAAGVPEACVKFGAVADDELRPALLTIARRALTPADPATTPSSSTHDRGQGS